MKLFLFEIKLLPLYSWFLSILLAISNAQDCAECLSKSIDNINNLNKISNITCPAVKVKSCLKLICEDNPIVWYKDQNVIMSSSSDIRDPAQYDYEYTNANYLALKIKSLRASDVGLYKYQALNSRNSTTRPVSCSFNLDIYGK